jgi:hypothetical protein
MATTWTVTKPSGVASGDQIFLLPNAEAIDILLGRTRSLPLS